MPLAIERLHKQKSSGKLAICVYQMDIFLKMTHIQLDLMMQCTLFLTETKMDETEKEMDKREIWMDQIEIEMDKTVTELSQNWPKMSFKLA